jgi:hypothetical protein
LAAHQLLLSRWRSDSTALGVTEEGIHGPWRGLGEGE